MVIQNELFKTDDTPLAAYLVTEGFSLIDVIFEGYKAFFLFSNDNAEFHELVKDFQLLRAKSNNAAQLISNFKELIKRTKRGY